MIKCNDADMMWNDSSFNMSSIKELCELSHQLRCPKFRTQFQTEAVQDALLSHGGPSDARYVLAIPP